MSEHSAIQESLLLIGDEVAAVDLGPTRESRAHGLRVEWDAQVDEAPLADDHGAGSDDGHPFCQDENAFYPLIKGDFSRIGSHFGLNLT